MTPSRRTGVSRRKRRDLNVRLFFEGRDIWVGVFWKVTDTRASDLSDGWEWRTLHVYICVLPCLPLLVTYSWLRPWADDAHNYEPAT